MAVLKKICGCFALLFSASLGANSDCSGFEASFLQHQLALDAQNTDSHAAEEEDNGFVTEYLALLYSDPCSDPNWMAVLCNSSSDRTHRDRDLDWLKLTYPKTSSFSADDVSWDLVKDYPMPGGFPKLPLHTHHFFVGAKLDTGGKHTADATRSIYGLLNTGRLGFPNTPSGGCCADVMRVFSKVADDYHDIDLLRPVQDALRSDNPSTDFAAASHTFALQEYDGVLHALVIVQYNCTASPSCGLGNVLLDAIICLNLEDQSIRKTADGKHSFSILDSLGTFSTVPDESKYKIAFSADVDAVPEQWHMNGVESFKAKGLQIVGFTTFYQNEAVLLQDPFTYKSADGGGGILQRLGQPGRFMSSAVSEQHFGFSQTMNYDMNGVHNLFHYTLPDGTDWISIFANNFCQRESSDAACSEYMSAAFAFEVNLMPQSNSSGLHHFDTSHYFAQLPVLNQNLGGTRPLGFRYGARDVFISAAGLMGGLVIHDIAGNYKIVDLMPPEELGLYDSFSFFEA